MAYQTHTQIDTYFGQSAPEPVAYGAYSEAEVEAFAEQASIRFDSLPWAADFNTEALRVASPIVLGAWYDLLGRLIDVNGVLTFELSEGRTFGHAAFNDLPLTVTSRLAPLFPTAFTTIAATGPGESDAQATERLARAAKLTAETGEVDDDATSERALRAAQAAKLTAEATAIAAGGGVDETAAQAAERLARAAKLNAEAAAIIAGDAGESAAQVAERMARAAKLNAEAAAIAAGEPGETTAQAAERTAEAEEHLARSERLSGFADDSPKPYRRAQAGPMVFDDAPAGGGGETPAPGGGVSEDQLAAAIAAHAANSIAHHTPPAGVGAGVDEDTVRAIVEEHRSDADAHHAPSYLGSWGGLSSSRQGLVELGDITLRYNRFWIVHDRGDARDHGPLDDANDGWRPIDGQYRGVAPSGQRVYDTADHTILDGALYFCIAGGTFTAAQIPGSSSWVRLAGLTMDEVSALILAAINEHASQANVHHTPPSGGGGASRTEVLVPFRPGARPTAILVESTGYVQDGNYTKYVSPHYVAPSGGFTVAVDDAVDFSDEPNIVALLAGGEVSDPIEASDPDPDAASLTKFYRQGNVIRFLSSNPGTIVTVHFIQNVGGSRYWNPDNRVQTWPQGGHVSPPLNAGHQWISGIRIIAVGDEKRIQLIADGDQPAGALRISFGLPGEARVEHLIAPEVGDPNSYRSGLVSNIPDGHDLDMSITNNNNDRTLHDGLHLEALVGEEKLAMETVEVHRRLGGLTFHEVLTETQYNALTTDQQNNGTVYFTKADA